MEGRFHRPKNKAELQEREAAGLWQAQVLARSIGEHKQKITIDVIQRIHRVFFEHVNPDIAGKFRASGQDIKKLRCTTPPPGTAVRNQMYEFWRDLDTRIAGTPTRPANASGKKAAKKNLERWNDQIVDLAAWTQYKMAAIHPFVDGNGRMARLLSLLLLYQAGYQVGRYISLEAAK